MRYNKQYIGIIIGVVICVLLVFAGVYATTTVGNDVSVGGALTVSGTSSSSFAGPVTVAGDFYVGDIGSAGSGWHNFYIDLSSGDIVANYYGDIEGDGTNGVGGYNWSSILNGFGNKIIHSGDELLSNFGFIGNGEDNRIITEQDDGGPYNDVGREAIVNGQNNLINITYHADFDGNAFIGGGYRNTIKASYGTIPGGADNVVSGSYGFAAGRRAQALAQGDFALSDSTNADFTINTADVFGARFSGGYYLTGGAVSVSSSGIRLDDGVMITTGVASPSGNCGTSGSLFIDKTNAGLYMCGIDAAWNVK